MLTKTNALNGVYMEDKKCFNCQASEQDSPVVNLRYRGKELWICPRCIPNMIHEPQIVQASLEEAK